MPLKPLRLCKHPSCRELTRDGYCLVHKRERDRETDRRRGTAAERGYTYRWSKYSKWFLAQPGNELCRLRLDRRCRKIAECVDHIKPPAGPDDPLFWDPSNHQAACLVCNSIKGNREIRGSDWSV